MGNDYSMCLGYERNKQPKQNLPFCPSQMETWPNQGIVNTSSGKVLCTAEEAFMIKKQESLNLHFIPCSKLKQRFEDVCEYDFDQEISQTDFCAMLANCKLLKADFPRTDLRWQRFYSKFIVIDENDVGSQSGRGQYSMTIALVALICLSQGSSDIKAKAICELFSGHRFLKQPSLGIRSDKVNQARTSVISGSGPRDSLGEPARASNLTKD